MGNLSQADWRRLNRAVRQLNSDIDPRTLSARSLAAFAALVSGGNNSFDFFTDNESYDSTPWHDCGELINAENMRVFAEFVHQHPLIPIALAQPLKTLKITDVVTQRQHERTDLYNQFYRLINTRYQMGLSLPVAPDLTICGVVSRGDRDFHERDKTLLTLIGPHIINAVRNALAYERISAALETTACGVIALNSSGAPVFISEFAQNLCGKYFAGEKREKSSLPETLDRWLAQTGSNKAPLDKPSLKPLKIENQHGVLHIRLMDNATTGERTVLLEEKSFSAPKFAERLPISPREAEILFWITQGKTDAVIGLICGISPRTVQKHVENIFIKLGVETRTAAMLRAFEIL